MNTYMQNAINNFHKNLTLATDLGIRMRSLNEASTAVQEKFGYTARYNEPGYVAYDDRDPSYKKINDAINTEMDYINDGYIEVYHEVMEVLTLLPHTARQQIVKIVGENLTTEIAV